MKKLSLSICLISLLTLTVKSQEVKLKLNSAKDSKAAMVEIKQDSLVVVYIDGKKYDSEILDIIDVDKIESINVHKGEKALEIYDSPRVIEITTKVKAIEAVEVKGASTKKAIKITATDGVIEINKGDMVNPLIVIDGEIQSRADFRALKADDIKSITILKEKSATALYGDKGKNGVVIVELMEWKKSKKKEH